MKQAEFDRRVKELGAIRKLRFIKKFAAASTKAYNALCSDCRLKVMRAKSGDVKRCKECNQAGKDIMKPLYDELMR